MARPFLILQLRPEDEASDDELQAFLKFGGLRSADIRRVRMEQAGVPDITLSDYAAIIMGGGPSNVSDDEKSKSPQQKRFEKDLQGLLDQVTATDFPYLGACYGLGILAQHLGGTVSKERYSEEVGAITVNLTDDASNDPLTKGLPRNFQAFGGHKEACQDVPPGATLLGSSANCPVQMIRYKRNIYGVQFHTELDRAGLALRINIYKDAGYFPPEDAEKLIKAAQFENVTTPEKILKRFVARYR